MRSDFFGFPNHRLPQTRIVWRMVLAAALAGSAGHADAGAPEPANARLACLILPDQSADIGSAVVGVIASVEVERGDVVKKGQVIARLRAEVERANTGVARSRADASADLRSAEAGRDYARQQLDRMQQLVTQNFMAPAAADKAKVDFDQAREHVEQVREQLQTSGAEVSVYQAQLSQRVIKSPFDGVVVERYMNPGERVEDKPILKVAALNPLRVEVVAPIMYFGSLQIGQDAIVKPELPGTQAHPARITQIDKVLDPASNTFRVRLTMPNDDDALPAGLRCQVNLGSKAASAAAAAAAAAAGGMPRLPALPGDAAAKAPGPIGPLADRR
jgi:RND family efflux transporter MFP subunit